MKRTFSTIRQLGASVFNKRIGRAQPSRSQRTTPRPTENLSSAETAATIEALLVDSHRLLTIVGTSETLTSHGATLSDWFLLRELRTSPSSLPLVAKRLRQSRHGLRRQLQRLIASDLVVVRTTEIEGKEERKFEPTAKGKQLLSSLEEKLGSVQNIGSGVSYRRATRLIKLLQRSLQNAEAAQA